MYLLPNYKGWAKKTGPFLNVDNFAMVSGICIERYCQRNFRGSEYLCK